ncbi:MAG: UDP-N-acetylmuramoyl-tripeptide--D-alanyl-D-alanine ligase [Candidatus Omnitrophota bacterium]
MFDVPELLRATRGKLVSGSVGVTVKGVSIDSRTVKKGEVFIAIKGDKFDGHDFIDAAAKKGASCIITRKEAKKKGVTFIKVKDTTRALGDIARFHRGRFRDIPVIAVTGSNGKTTAKDMIAWVLAEELKVLKNEGTKNNHIGLPLALLQLDNSYDVAVLEVGTNHPGEVKYLSRIAQANIGVITNIGPSHLESFKDLKGVLKEKSGLIKSLNSPAIAILNADDEFLRKEALKKECPPFVIGSGIKNKCDFRASEISYIRAKASFTVNKRFRFALDAPGYYNIYNSLLAIAAGRIFGLGYREISGRLAGFKLPKGRLSFLEIKGVRFIDDTYNSNPLSMKQALGVLKGSVTSGRKILVMGDMLELGARSMALHGEVLNQALKITDAIVTVGNITKSCLNKLSRQKRNIFSCQTSSEARSVLFETIRVRPGDIVLVKGSRAMQMEKAFKI